MKCKQSSLRRKNRLQTSVMVHEQQSDPVIARLLDELDAQGKQVIIIRQPLESSVLKELQLNQQIMRADMQKIMEAVQKTQAELQEFKRGEEQRDLAEKKRDQLLHRRVNLIQRVVMATKSRVTELFPLVKDIQRRVKQIGILLASGTFYSDVALDLAREVCKEAVAEEIEAVANQVREIFRPIVEPFFGPIWEVLSPIYSAIPLKIKATIAIITIVALIINHAGSVCRPSRRGSNK